MEDDVNLSMLIPAKPIMRDPKTVPINFPTPPSTTAIKEFTM